MTDAEAEVRTATTSFTCYWTEAWESSIEKGSRKKKKTVRSSRLYFDPSFMLPSSFLDLHRNGTLLSSPLQSVKFCWKCKAGDTLGNFIRLLQRF